jgi:hypothetical protein
MSDTNAFSTLFAFQRIAYANMNGTQTFVGSIAGELVFSVNAGHVPPKDQPPSRKRSRDTTEDEAQCAVDKVRKSEAGAKIVTQKSFETAQSSVEKMLKIRGATGERIIEAWAVSMRTSGQWGASVNTPAQPNIVIAFRLSAGVAIPLWQLCSALDVCRDGIITVDAKQVSSEFDLPMSDQAHVAQKNGQRSILVFATIPITE